MTYCVYTTAYGAQIGHGVYCVRGKCIRLISWGDELNKHIVTLTDAGHDRGIHSRPLTQHNTSSFIAVIVNIIINSIIISSTHHASAWSV